MNKKQAEDLLKLADHLERGKRALDYFDFGEVIGARFDEKGHVCGSAGCALGELPAAFPERFKYARNRNGVPNAVDYIYNKTEWMDTFNAARHFFGIDLFESSFCFSPFGKLRSGLGNGLTHKSSTTEVAANLRKFVQLKIEAGEIL